jgi:hypothetical protein
MFSVVILTLNEERDLPLCLASVKDCDDVVILDSGSTDRTVEIARAAGARVFANPFRNFGDQRNFAQRKIPFRHPWVMHLDADEQMTPELIGEANQATASTNSGTDGYLIAPRMIFESRWIPHCTDYPAYQARLVRAPEFEFIQVGHGQREAPHMRLQKLSGNYLHDLSSDGETGWLAKHRRYATAEAHTHHALIQANRWGELYSRDALLRRRALKRLSYRLPFRPTLRFIYQYFLRGGFLDGPPGLRYCLLLRRYEQFVNEAVRALRERKA